MILKAVKEELHIDIEGVFQEERGMDVHKGTKCTIETDKILTLKIILLYGRSELDLYMPEYIRKSMYIFK